MSRFLSAFSRRLDPYVPGEQPVDKQYIKLNTNENPYPPAPGVIQAIAAANTGDLRLYPDPEVGSLAEAMAEYHSLPDKSWTLPTAGSDEALGYSFMAFFEPGERVYFPDVTYGFYQVYARLNRLEAVEIPLREDFRLALEDYMDCPGPIVLANPNAPTGMALGREGLETLIAARPDRLVLVDEAYIDFAGDKSCVPLLTKYDNLLVVQTFSKSRSLAGMRIGCALGNPELIRDLNRIKYSFNPYNLDRTAIAAGIASLRDRPYLDSVVHKVVSTKDRTAKTLAELGFQVLPSETNFLFVRHSSLSGEQLYRKCKEQGILVRHFGKERIQDFVRVTVGTDGEMDWFLQAVGTLL